MVAVVLEEPSSALRKREALLDSAAPEAAAAAAAAPEAASLAAAARRAQRAARARREAGREVLMATWGERHSRLRYWWEDLGSSIAPK